MLFPAMNMELSSRGSKMTEWGMIQCSRDQLMRGEREALGRRMRESGPDWVM